MKNILLLGATGSIGSQVLDIIDENPEVYSLKAFSFGHNINKAKEIIKKYKPKLVVTPFIEEYEELKKTCDIEVSKNLLDVVSFETNNPYVVNAIVGINGLLPTIETIKAKRILLLANKESLVMAGELIKSLCLEYNGVIVPIDSEHSALYQLLQKTKKAEIKNIYITASGGALRDYPKKNLANVNVEEVLAHPNWQMGAKITVDSATMMNKAFELVEAYYLFNFNYNRIKALIDRNSKIHAMIEKNDGNCLVHYAKNDMHLPIRYALEYPDSMDFNESTKSFSLEYAVNEYQLSSIDIKRYPLIKLADYIIENKKFAGVVVTTANDILVDKFLQRKIKFIEIEKELFNIIDKYHHRFDHLEFNIENILKVQKIIIEEVK